MPSSCARTLPRTGAALATAPALAKRPMYRRRSGSRLCEGSGHQRIVRRNLAGGDGRALDLGRISPAFTTAGGGRASDAQFGDAPAPLLWRGRCTNYNVHPDRPVYSGTSCRPSRLHAILRAILRGTKGVFVLRKAAVISIGLLIAMLTLPTFGAAASASPETQSAPASRPTPVLRRARTPTNS